MLSYVENFCVKIFISQYSILIHFLFMPEILAKMFWRQQWLYIVSKLVINNFFEKLNYYYFLFYVHFNITHLELVLEIFFCYCLHLNWKNHPDTLDVWRSNYHIHSVFHHQNFGYFYRYCPKRCIGCIQKFQPFLSFQTIDEGYKI